MGQGYDEGSSKCAFANSVSLGLEAERNPITLKLKSKIGNLSSEVQDHKPMSSLRGYQRTHVNIVLPYLAVKSRAIDAEKVCRSLLVTAGALKRLLDY